MLRRHLPVPGVQPSGGRERGTVTRAGKKVAWGAVCQEALGSSPSSTGHGQVLTAGGSDDSQYGIRALVLAVPVPRGKVNPRTIVVAPAPAGFKGFSELEILESRALDGSNRDSHARFRPPARGAKWDRAEDGRGQQGFSVQGHVLQSSRVYVDPVNCTTSPTSAVPEGLRGL